MCAMCEDTWWLIQEKPHSNQMYTVWLCLHSELSNTLGLIQERNILFVKYVYMRELKQAIWKNTQGLIQDRNLIDVHSACTHSSRLKRHTRTHTGEKPYQCSQMYILWLLVVLIMAVCINIWWPIQKRNHAIIIIFNLKLFSKWRKTNVVQLGLLVIVEI